MREEGEFEGVIEEVGKEGSQVGEGKRECGKNNRTKVSCHSFPGEDGSCSSPRS